MTVVAMLKNYKALVKQFLVFFCVGLFTLAKANETPVSLSQNKGLENIRTLMQENDYDSAEALITILLLQTDEKIDSKTHYFLNAVEAEIMYNNALFDIGLLSAENAIELAKNLNNKVFIGEALNLEGMHLSNIGELTAARSSFLESIKTLPHGLNNSSLSQRYNVLNNLSDLYLRMQKADSAVYFAELAFAEAVLINTKPDEASALRNLSEGCFKMGDTTRAFATFYQANSALNGIKETDANLLLCMTAIKLYDSKKAIDSVFFAVQNGFSLLSNSKITDKAKISFLVFVADYSLKEELLDIAFTTIDKLKNYRHRVFQRQEKQRIRLLKTYYIGKAELAEARLLANAQQKELALRKTIMYAIGGVFLITIISFFLGYTNYKKRQSIISLELANRLKDEQKVLDLKALEEKYLALNQERSRIASDLHDEIGATLSSINIYSSIALKKKNEGGELPEELMRRVKNSSIILLDRMSDIIWSINPENETLRDLFLRVKSFASEFLSPLDIEIDYELEEKLEKIQLSVNARKNIFLTIKEAITNIAKHSNATRVVVKTILYENNLTCIISDNGMVLKTIGNGGGNGLNNMKKRMQLLGGELYVYNESFNGFTIEFKIPLTNISD